MRPQRRARITLLDRFDDAQAWLAQHPHILNVTLIPPNNGSEPRPTLLVALEGQDEAVAALLAELVAAGFPVLSFVEERDTLESLFLDLTQGIVS